MERDKSISDRTISREQRPIPQAHKPSQGTEANPLRGEAELAEEAKEGFKDASGKLPAGEV
ncbi:hypothetical protein [Rhizobium sp. S163]|uniref:hypothetical protein n=1 Tax=Rhizobium sp. S163 TaxID=3055039 RepID=UPI0025A93C0D|nr:hypothetical protein [Rhizobium sp. S163]MDM9646762.1 hypothetical protein [Rhizobium sp. S163]